MTTPSTRAIAYVDGFNLYYGSLKGTKFRWLDPLAMCRRILPSYDFQSARYFTAPIIPDARHPGSAQNQQTYLRALETIPGVEIHLGRFLKKRSKGYLVDSASNKATGQLCQVETMEEKGSDVNLAVYLLLDAFDARCDAAIIVSNDSDLLEPVRLVKSRFGLRVGAINPHGKNACQFATLVDHHHSIWRSALRQSQLPAVLHDERGPIHKPGNW